MPAKKTTTRKKQTKPVANVKSTNKKTWCIVLVAALILLVGLVFYWTVGGGNKMSAQAKMATYLENKYGKEFVVENYRVEGSGIGVEGDPTADAYPKTEPDLKFLIWDRGKFHLGNHAYSDNYINVVWGQEQTKAMSSAISKIFGYTPNYKATIGFNGTLSNTKNIPTVGEAMSKLSNVLSLALTVHPKESIDESSKSLHSQRVLELISLLKSYNVDQLTITYGAANGTGGIYLENDKLRSINSVEQVTEMMKEQQ